MLYIIFIENSVWKLLALKQLLTVPLLSAWLTLLVLKSLLTGGLT